MVVDEPEGLDERKKLSRGLLLVESVTRYGRSISNGMTRGTSVGVNVSAKVCDGTVVGIDVSTHGLCGYSGDTTNIVHVLTLE